KHQSERWVTGRSRVRRCLPRRWGMSTFLSGQPPTPCVAREEEASMLATEWSFGSFLWATVVVFFWFIFIWIFITLFPDIFRRDVLSGGSTPGWSFLMPAESS